MSFLPPLGGTGRGRGSADGRRGPADLSGPPVDDRDPRFDLDPGEDDPADDDWEDVLPGLTRAEYHGGRRQPASAGSGAMPRALGLTALGTAVPGAGLTRTRYRVLGWALVGVAVLGVLLLAGWVMRNGALQSALDVATRPGMLRTVAVLLVVGGLAWAGTVVLTAVTARPDPMTGRQRGVLAGFTALMCLVLAAPVGVGLWYIGAHTAAVDRIFVPSADGPDGPAVTDRPDLEQEDPWGHLERINVLLLGSDAGDNREGIRTDSMIVASVDTRSGDMVMFSIPRNLEDVPVPATLPLAQKWPDGYNCGAECLMNGIWTEAEAHAEEHPELYDAESRPGLVATREVLSAVLGLPIHHTVIVNLAGFQDLVDAMGGVEIDVQERVPMGGQNATDAEGNSYLVPGTENGWIEKGPQRLSGWQALWYARSRVTTDDFSRMRRQRCVVAALVDQVNPLSMLQRYPQIAAAAGDNISVDIDTADLPAWAELVERVQDGTIRSLPFTIQNTDVADPDFDRIRNRVQRAIEPPEPPAATSSPDTATAVPEGEGEPEPTADPAAPAPPEEAEETPQQGEGRPEDELADVGAVC